MTDYQINTKRLFLASRIALIATAMTFAIRASLLKPLGEDFAISSGDMGLVAGTAFWGFTLSMISGGILCDWLGMKRLIMIAFVSHILGIVLTMVASGFWSLFISTLFIGIANGMVEAACNPLVATLYPDHKTEQLNRFHVWFPGGIVLGGLAAYGLTALNASWEWQLAVILIPTLIYGILFFNQTFPATERVQSGVSMKDMLKECRQPLFIFMVVCMCFTAATELGTNQWITALLEHIGVPSILLLVFINGIMAVGRSFAGPVEQKFSSAGMLLFSAVCSATGLLLLGFSEGYLSFGAAAVFAIGICFFWPTMLGYVSEHLPKTGALGLSIMGGAGMLSVSLIVPFIGDFYDMKLHQYIPANVTIEELKAFAKDSETGIYFNMSQLYAGADTLKYVAILPAVLSVAFGWLYVKRKK